MTNRMTIQWEYMVLSNTKEKGGKCPFEKVGHHQNPVGKLCMGSNVCIKKCISLPLLKAPMAEQITLCLNCLTKLLIEKCNVNLDRCSSRMCLSWTRQRLM